MPIGIIFPGQGSQKIGMGASVATQYPAARALFETADKLLGKPLSNLCWDGPETELAKTVNTQPALFVTSIAIWQILKPLIKEPICFAGHSLGEITALCAGGAFSFEAGLQMVQRRADLMELAVPAGQGAMSAVLSMLTRENIEEIISPLQSQGVITIANINAPGQIVISGTADLVAKAGDKLKSAGAKRVIPLTVSGPFHSQLMEPASINFKLYMDSTIQFQAMHNDVYSNVTTGRYQNEKDIPELLSRQLFNPVRWVEEVDRMIKDGVTRFIEVGSGKVLAGLIKKIAGDKPVISVENADDILSFT